MEFIYLKVIKNNYRVCILIPSITAYIISIELDIATKGSQYSVLQPEDFSD